MKTLLFALLAGTLTLAARADTVTFTLSQPTQIATPGTTLHYSGTVSADPGNTAPVFLNGDSFFFAGTYTLDDSAFLTHFPGSLGMGQSQTDVLFDIEVPLGALPDVFSGTFFLYGGAHENSSDLLASANFATTVTPEPSTWLLCMSGLLAIIFLARRQATHAPGRIVV